MSDPSREVQRLYALHAERFDLVRTRSLMEREYLDAATRHCPPPGRVLDLGCGSGEPLARYFIERGYMVTGVDTSGPLLRLCHERFPAMTWVERDMRDLALGERFEIVLAWDSFFHLERVDHGDALYHASLDGDEYRTRLERSGYRVVLQRSEDPACGGHTVWLARAARDASWTSDGKSNFTSSMTRCKFR